MSGWTGRILPEVTRLLPQILVWELCTKRLTRYNGRYSLSVDLEHFEGESCYAEYAEFEIRTSRYEFELHSKGNNPNSTAGDGFNATVPFRKSHMDISAHGQKFSTSDNENDHSAVNCAVNFHGAWWYESCHSSNLNGRYHGGRHLSYADCINWYPWH